LDVLPGGDVAPAVRRAALAVEGSVVRVFGQGPELGQGGERDVGVLPVNGHLVHASYITRGWRRQGTLGELPELVRVIAEGPANDHKFRLVRGGHLDRRRRLLVELLQRLLARLSVREA